MAAKLSSTPDWALLCVASAGNTLGGVTGIWVGRLFALRFPGERLRDRRSLRAVLRVRRHGAPVLFLSWLPVVGDPLCVAAGWAGTPFAPSVFWIALGKTARYAALLFLIS